MPHFFVISRSVSSYTRGRLRLPLMDSSAHLANKEGKNRISRRGNVETIKDERANAAVHESRGRKLAKAILDRGRERVRMRERERGRKRRRKIKAPISFYRAQLLRRIKFLDTYALKLSKNRRGRAKGKREREKGKLVLVFLRLIPLFYSHFSTFPKALKSNLSFFSRWLYTSSLF